jgi:cysteine-rich repeat protein
VGNEACDDGNTSPGDGCSAACQVEGVSPEDCSDGVDNDDDGLADCDDSDCAALCVDPEDCEDGIDNDGDLAIDCADDDCRLAAACSVEVVEEDCATPGDEDGNGDADCDDSTCSCECGDGAIQNDEMCDDGADNSDELANACRTNCSPARCGDEVVDSGEQCDGSAPEGSLCEECQLRPVSVCGESGRYLELSVDGSDGTLSAALDFGTSAVDDFTLPATCTMINGRDVTVQLTVPADGTYVLELIGSTTNDRFAVSQAVSCDAGFATQCASATRARPAGLVMELQAASPVVLRIEATPITTAGTLTVQQVDSILASGAECDADDARNPCGIGLECAEGIGMTVCAPVPVMPGMVGESCSPGISGECVEGASCDSELLSCQPLAGTTCPTVLALDDFMGEDGEAFDVAFVRSTGVLQGSCETFPSTIALNMDVRRPTWVSVDLQSDDGSPVAISARSTCTQSLSETTCRRSNSGQTNALFYLPGTGDGGTLVLSGLSSASVTLRRIPARASSETCDSMGETNRCQPGLECVSGTCQTALAGTCGDPLPGFLAAEGELTGRGLALNFDTSTVSSVTRAGCASTLRRQVFRFESPESGTLLARLGEGVSGAFVELESDCAESPDLDGCTGNVSTSRVVRAGEVFDLAVSSSATVSGLLTLSLEVQNDVGGVCAAASDCLPGLNCVAETCAAQAVPPGSACIPSVSECTTGNTCLPAGGGFVCSSSVVGDRQPCEVFAGFPTCRGPLVCVDEGGGKLCSAPVVPDCVSDSECSAAFRCSSGECVPRVAGGEGTPCDVFTPTSCAAGFSCTVPSGGAPGAAVCTENGGVECDGTRPCGDGRVCFEGACYTALASGASCDPDAPPPCALGLACGGTSGAETCGGGLGGSGAACASTAACQAGLYCNIIGPSGFCAARRAAGAPCTSIGPPDQCVAGYLCQPDPVTTFFVCTAAP